MKPLVVVCLLWVVSCGRPSEPPSAKPSSAAPAVVTTPARLQMLTAAELARDSTQITEQDLSSRDVLVRRSASRALARIADRRSAKLLSQAVADEDPDVVAWAVYGLGFSCPLDDQKNVRTIATRAASWTWKQATVPHSLDVELAFAQALARCGTRNAETTLRAWLAGPKAQAEAAAIGLATLAARRGRLDDASVVALLDAADHPERPLDNALLAFSHLDRSNTSVQHRLRTVAAKAAKGRGNRRRFALRALGLAGKEAVTLLLPIVENHDASPEERAEAARQLVRLGEDGQPALARALVTVAPTRADPKALLSPGFAVVSAVLGGLESAPREARDTLVQLAELEIPNNSPPAVQRRATRLRCTAAALLAGSASLSARLVSCDPARGRQGRLAVVQVLDRGRIAGARYRRWKSLAMDDDAIVREAALRLLVKHPEIERPHEVLAAALGAKHNGVVTTAAQILANFPDRAGDRESDERAVEGGPLGEGDPTAPNPEVVKALTNAMAKSTAADALQRRVALIDAAGALQLLSFKPQLGEACESEHVVLRQRAQRALRLLGERRRECQQAKKKTRVPLPKTVTAEKLTLKTDIGELTIELNGQWTPQATERVVGLARAGFYDGTVVHRATPGFIVQFGDPEGDGFGGARKPPLRCETSPVPFMKGSVGVAIAGRDMGSSQLFVTLGPYPHLNGEYTRLGTAKGPWNQLVPGDVITKMTAIPR